MPTGDMKSSGTRVDVALTAYQVILDCDEIGHWLIAGHLDFAKVSHYTYNVQLVWINKNRKKAKIQQRKPSNVKHTSS